MLRRVVERRCPNCDSTHPATSCPLLNPEKEIFVLFATSCDGNGELAICDLYLLYIHRREGHNLSYIM